MGEDNIKLGPGTLYVNGEKFTGVQEVTFTKEPDEMREFVDGMYNLQMASQEFTSTVEMTTAAWARLARVLLGIDRYLYEHCSNRRVRHLAYHARKPRTRKKNYNRMIRLCER